MYTPKQASQMIGVPGSTIRRYSVDFKEFLSDAAQPARGKRWYTDSDVLVLKKIRYLTSQRKSPDEIRRLLPVMDNIPDQPKTALSMVPEIQQNFDIIRSDISRERSEREKLSERMARLEAWYELPWWRRLFKRPPKNP